MVRDEGVVGLTESVVRRKRQVEERGMEGGEGGDLGKGNTNVNQGQRDFNKPEPHFCRTSSTSGLQGM